jgi:gluconolactonase
MTVIFADNLGDPEAPVLLSDLSWLVAEMQLDRGWITHLSADGRTRRAVVKTGRPNGLTIDRAGRIWIAETLNPSLSRLTLDGECEVVMTACDGEPFLWPNDLRIGPDGALYLTDSGVLFREWARLTADQRARVGLDGRVYRIDVAAGTCQTLDAGIAFANGIAFGPDAALYVSASRSGNVYRYPWAQGKIGHREHFGAVMDPDRPRGPGGPDGMAFDANGHLYVTVYRQGHVAVLDAGGTVVKRIDTAGSSPTNVAFGSPGSRRIYVTEVGNGQFEVHDVDADGFPLHR